MQGISAGIMPFTVLLSSLLPQVVVAASSKYTDLGMQSEFRIGTAFLQGESGEYVYDADGSGSGIPGYKVSELNWKLNNVLMLGVGATYMANDRLCLNADYWVNAGEGDGTMDDYDWLYIGADWSHWSHHDNTTVRKVTRLDLNSEFTFHRIKNEKTRFFGRLGYRQDHFDWQAKGGTAIYSDLSFRDTALVFPNVPGISYQQTFKTPYIGLGLHSSGRADDTKISFDASIHYSQWVKGEDVDIHHLRDLRFEESGSGGHWYELKLGLTFELLHKLSLTTNYAVQRYDEIKASTEITDLTNGDKFYFGGAAAGLDHGSQLISVNLDYSF